MSISKAFMRIYRTYRQLLGVLFPEAPWMVVMTFLAAAALGLMNLLTVIIYKHLFDDGLALAEGRIAFSQYIPVIIVFIILAVLPPILTQVYIYGFVEQHALLIIRTIFKRKMLQKLSRLKYEHMENAASFEVIDKAYNRTEQAARHLFPMYVVVFTSNLIASVGVLTYIGLIRWWLLITILVPAAVELVYQLKHKENIYVELESYWNRERQYATLGGYLRSRDFVKELKLFGSAAYLINTYRDRLHQRNMEYERFFFRHLKKSFAGMNITKLAKIANALLILWLFLSNEISIGVFIAISLLILTDLFNYIYYSVSIVFASNYHINFFNYYDQYFALSEDDIGLIKEMPEHFDVTFKDVWFRYPGTDRDILRGVSFCMHEGEKLSIVGVNGEGKTTIVKLLLGLFQQDRGEILLDGKPLMHYDSDVRTRVFGSVFQDFIHYAISIRENIGIGDINSLNNDADLIQAAEKGKVTAFASKLPHGYETILGREFTGGVDLSGGQWQRVAIARAFMGNKPVLLLDEPTSQLDPVAESQLYKDFLAMASGKTALFITHRLASTMITDRILVIQNGIVTQQGSHESLMRSGGLYAEMFNAQKQWYQQVNSSSRKDVMNGQD